MAEIDKIHDKLEALNRQREQTHAEQRAQALEMAKQRNDLYLAAIGARDAIGRGAIDNRTNQIVTVYDPDLLDKDTLVVLEHMGTPVPPVDEVYPDGVTYPRNAARASRKEG